MTNDSSYDELPQHLNGTLYYPVTPPPDLAARTIASGRRARRRGRALVGAGSVAVVALGAVAIPVSAAHLRTHSVTRIDALGSAPSHPGAPTHPGISSHPGAPRHPAISSQPGISAPFATPPGAPPASASAVPSTPFPRHFLADIGAGGERQTVVDTASGTRGRVLTPADQGLGVVSNDGKTLWEPVGSGATWSAISVATGVTKPAPQFAGDRDFAISPTDGALATWDGGTLRVGAAHRPANSAPYQAWAADGQHLVVTTATGVAVLDRTLHVTLALTTPSGCRYDVPHFRGDRTLVIGKTCSHAGTSSIMFDDSVSGKRLGSAVIATGAAPGSLFGIASMDVDTAGNVIAVLSKNVGIDGVVYTVSARSNAVHAQGIHDVFQVSWLPRSD